MEGCEHSLQTPSAEVLALLSKPSLLDSFKPFGTSPAPTGAGDFDGVQRDPLPTAQSREVFLGGLRNCGDVPDDEIWQYFARFGQVERVEMHRDRRRHDQRGFCFVTFQDAAGATACLKQQQHILRGNAVTVEMSHREPASAEVKKPPRRQSRKNRAGGDLVMGKPNAPRPSNAPPILKSRSIEYVHPPMTVHGSNVPPIPKSQSWAVGGHGPMGLGGLANHGLRGRDQPESRPPLAEHRSAIPRGGGSQVQQINRCYSSIEEMGVTVMGPPAKLPGAHPIGKSRSWETGGVGRSYSSSPGASPPLNGQHGPGGGGAARQQFAPQYPHPPRRPRPHGYSEGAYSPHLHAEPPLANGTVSPLRQGAGGGGGGELGQEYGQGTRGYSERHQAMDPMGPPPEFHGGRDPSRVCCGDLGDMGCGPNCPVGLIRSILPPRAPPDTAYTANRAPQHSAYSPPYRQQSYGQQGPEGDDYGDAGRAGQKGQWVFQAGISHSNPPVSPHLQPSRSRALDSQLGYGDEVVMNDRAFTASPRLPPPPGLDFNDYNFYNQFARISLDQPLGQLQGREAR